MNESHIRPDALSESVEMYLKTVHELEVGEDYVPISAVAAQLDISPVSATEMVHRLETDGLFEHVPYRGVRLSPSGDERAQQILRRHRLWECFLHGELGLGWAEVHDQACALEHAVDGTVTESLADWLGQPSTCPHGNPIPDSPVGANLGGTPLVELAEGESAVVVRIRPERFDVLAYLEDRGLLPGTPIRLSRREALDGTLELALGSTSVVVGEKVAAHVIVRSLPSTRTAGA